MSSESILTRVQKNPEISTNDSTFVTDLVAIAKSILISECRMPRYPELAQGYTKSGASPSTDLSGLASNSFYISVNGSDLTEVEITLANCTTGDLTAAELQTRIRSEGEDLDGEFALDEVTVVYDDSTEGSEYYQITSPWYGEGSRVHLSFDSGSKAVARALKLTKRYGATELCGSAADDELDDACVRLCSALYRTLGVEGLAQYQIDGQINMARLWDMAPGVKSIVLAKRRIY